MHNSFPVVLILSFWGQITGWRVSQSKSYPLESQWEASLLDKPVQRSCDACMSLSSSIDIIVFFEKFETA